MATHAGPASPSASLGIVRRIVHRLTGAASAPPRPPGFGNPFGAGAQVPGLEGAAARRRLALWQPASVHINALLQNAGPTVLARARWLCRNNGYAKAAIESWTAATVGSGISPTSEVEDGTTRAANGTLRPVSLARDNHTREAIQHAWEEWSRECDAEGVTDFYGLTRRAARENFLAGECFIRFRPRFPQDGLTVPLQLQLIPSEQLPMNRQVEYVPAGLGNDGGQIRLGIEFDRNVRDRRVAYWFLTTNPTDLTTGFRDLWQQGQLVRVPASEVLHIFDPVEAGQIRGLTRFSASVVKLFQLDMYDDAELERQTQQSRYATFIEVPESRDETTGLLMNARPEDDPVDRYLPGATVELYGGEKVQFAQPGGAPSSYEAFQNRVLLALSAALGIPYSELTGDLSKATYASSRAGLLAFRQAVEAFQKSVMVFQMLRPVWARWMDTAVLARALPIPVAAYTANPRLYRAMKPVTPRAPWVDPLKDRQASKLALDAGVISEFQATAEEGQDYETVCRERAFAKDLRAAYGLPEPTPGWGSRVGTTQPQPSQPESSPTTEAA